MQAGFGQPQGAARGGGRSFYPYRLDAYSTTSRDLEQIYWLWYDTQTYTSGTTTQLNFFTSVQTNKILGNLRVAGQLEAPQSFYIHAIRFVPKITAVVSIGTSATVPPTGAQVIADFFALLNNGFLELRIGDKVYGEFPLYTLPAGGGVVGEQNTSTATTTAATNIFGISGFGNNGLPDPRAIFTIVPLKLDPQVSFRCVVTWSAAQTLNVGNTALQVVLEGVLERPKQ